jgi:O-antigen biosynthesis protein WbqV
VLPSWARFIHGRAATILAIDLFLCALSWPAAIILRLGDVAVEQMPYYRDAIVVGVPLAVVICGAVFGACGLYRTLWRYVSLQDVISIAKTVAIAIAIFTGAMATVTWVKVPRSVPVIQYLLLVASMTSTRVVYREFLWWSQRRRDSNMWRIPTLLVGVNTNAELFIRATESDPRLPYSVVALLDLDGGHVGRMVHRVPVLGRVDDLPAVVEQLRGTSVRPQRVLIADDTGKVDTPRLADEAEALGMTVAYLPALTALRGRSDRDERRNSEIAVQDLLRRPAVVLSHEKLSDLIAGRRILVTGAGGSIGSELCRQIASYGPGEMVLIESSEYSLYNIDLDMSERHPSLPRRAVLCDVRQRAQVMRLFREYRPELVFHAAALKHVPLAEANPTEAILTNTLGTRNVADAARDVHALAMVQISTDKAVNPSSIMGASKRLAEYYTQALDLVAQEGSNGSHQPTRFVTVRFGNVLASSGSVVQLFQRQLAKGGPLTVTHPEIRRFFMTIGEAVSLVLQASAYGISNYEERGRILVLDMGQPVRILDIAHQMIRLAGREPNVDVPIEFTGLRPGEKLEEELFDPAELLLKTEVDGVLSASATPLLIAEIRPILDEIAKLALDGNVRSLRDRVAVLIPGCRMDQFASTDQMTAVSAD